MNPSSIAQIQTGRPRHIPVAVMPMRPMRPFRKIVLPYSRPTRPPSPTQNGNGPNNDYKMNLKFEAPLHKNDEDYRAHNSDTLPDTSNLKDDLNTQMQPDKKLEQQFLQSSSDENEQFHVSDDNDEVKTMKLSEVPKISENVLIDEPIMKKSLGLVANCSTESDEHGLPEEVPAAKLNIPTDLNKNNLSKNSNASEEVTQPKLNDNDTEYSNGRLRLFNTMIERAMHLEKFYL